MNFQMLYFLDSFTTIVSQSLKVFIPTLDLFASSLRQALLLLQVKQL